MLSLFILTKCHFFTNNHLNWVTKINLLLVFNSTVFVGSGSVSFYTDPYFGSRTTFDTKMIRILEIRIRNTAQHCKY